MGLFFTNIFNRCNKITMVTGKSGYYVHNVPRCGRKGKEMSDWQPIETAPKDGTHILTWREGDNIRETFWRKFDSSWGGEAWSYPEWAAPTHWMTKPELPSDN